MPLVLFAEGLLSGHASGWSGSPTAVQGIEKTSIQCPSLPDLGSHLQGSVRSVALVAELHLVSVPSSTLVGVYAVRRSLSLRRFVKEFFATVDPLSMRQRLRNEIRQAEHEVRGMASNVR
jgi:hypothetical protein